MPEKSLWDHINLALPPLMYANTETSGQGKGSTKWAAFSRTPTSVCFWGDFDTLVDSEAQKPRSSRVVDSAFSEELSRLVRKEAFLEGVREEEDVTDRLKLVLSEFSGEDNGDLSGGVGFRKTSKHISANPDLIAERKDKKMWGDGPIDDYKSPKNKAAQRRGVMAAAQTLYLFPFETKPFWKFHFLLDPSSASSHQILIDEWEVPDNFEPESMRDEDALPESWSQTKKKVFHVIRQLYGQMESARRRYGILHIYECWFFCRRTEGGALEVSRSFQREDTSPSIFQAIRTLIFFQDHELDQSQLHPKSARKAPPKKKAKKDDVFHSKETHSYGRPPNPGSRGGGGKQERATGSKSPPQRPDADTDNLAASLHLSDCELYDATDTVQLLTTTIDDSVLVKLQRDPQMAHVGSEMRHEAAMYEAFVKAGLVDVIPRFRGFSMHLGVALSCTSWELDDFDDIGIENLSKSLKESALQCVTALSLAGVLHNDIELRNFVQSRDNPERAKIIDFGRATFSNDKTRLAAQVERARTLLHLID